MDFGKAQKTASQVWCRLDQRVDGMLNAYSCATANTAKTLEGESLSDAQVEIFEEKGLIVRDELDAVGRPKFEDALA